MAPRSRRVLLLVAFSIMVALIPFASHAQSDDPALYIDTMDDATPPLLSEDTPDPALFGYEYLNDEYVLQAFDPTHAGDLFSYITTGPLSDSRTAIDAALGGEQRGKYLFVGCRAGDDHDGYYLEVQPSSPSGAWTQVHQSCSKKQTPPP